MRKGAPMTRFGTLLLLTLGLTFLTQTGHGGAKDRWKSILPEDIYKELVQREAKLIVECLKSDDEDKIKRARVGALMIQAYAASYAKSGAVADMAQDLGKAIRAKGKLEEAKKLATALADGVEAKVNPNKRDWRAELDLFDIMNPLDKKPKKGGDGLPEELQINIRLKGALNGIEEKVRNLAAKKLNDTQMGKASRELTLLAYRMAVLG